jgi:hypothetical protein
MDILFWVGFVIIVAAALLYLNNKWNEAKVKRDVAESLAPGAGIVPNKKRPSAFPYLFK